MSTSQIITIGNDQLTARVSNMGAELHSLVPGWGDELIWHADPAVWGWHAPNLFPIVGALRGDRLLHQGMEYSLKSHGFLRQSETELVSCSADRASFRLCDNAETRQHYPFAFELTISFSVEDDSLTQSFTVHNPATTPLLLSLGAHPAFRWPLNDKLPRAGHRIHFQRDEPQGIHRISSGGLGPEPLPTPVQGRVLALQDSQFDQDAIIWDRLNSARLTYGVPGALGIEMEFADFPHFGLWTKPGGANFICLEPWQGHISPLGFDGEFATKPGVVAIAPGDSRRWALTIRPLPIMPD